MVPLGRESEETFEDRLHRTSQLISQSVQMKKRRELKGILRFPTRAVMPGREIGKLQAGQGRRLGQEQSLKASRKELVAPSEMS